MEPIPECRSNLSTIHGLYARALRQTGPDPVAATAPDDGRHAGGEGEAEALARAQLGQETRRTAGQAHDPGRPWARRSLLRGRSPCLLYTSDAADERSSVD